MHSDDLERLRPLAWKYLEHMEALAEEIRAGMDAVGANALSSFEQSVAKQQELCMSLSRLTGQRSIEQAMMGQQGGRSQPLSASDRVLERKIELTGELLQELGLQYAALLKHSGESVRLFAGLCQSYTGHLQSQVASGAPRATWSCES